MLTIFWDSQGPVLETYVEHGTTVTSATYCYMLQRGLKPAMSEGVLLHNNVSAHTAAGMLEHPAHSPDLVPSDFHLFWTA
jgi:hypothetical protein